MTKHDHSIPIAEGSVRIKALQAAMRQIEKDFGRGSVMFLGQQPTEPIEVIPTGSMALNAALGIGGYPRGRIVEIYGGEASGKTSLAKTRTTCIFINQLREKINVPFGNPEVTTGGNALKFYASLRLDVRRFSNIKKDGYDIGAMTRVKVVKNKMAPPFRSCDFELIFGRGISHLAELLQLGLTLKVLHKTGAWYSLGDRHIAMGREAFLQTLAENHELRNDIEARITEQLAQPDTVEEFDWAFLDQPSNNSSPF